MKAHIAQSPIPLKEGGKIKAACGKTVKNAAFLFWVEGYDPTKMTVTPLLICPKCMKVEMKVLRYVYGIVNAQEIRTQNEIDT